MLNPVLAMVHNAGAERWHPILFIEKPLPGPPAPDIPIRHKSAGHHTEGFETREAALHHIADELRPVVEKAAVGPVRECLDKDFPWDGTGVPAQVSFFVETPDGLVPA